MEKIIYHFSEASNISYFEPRFATPELGGVVWGVSEAAMYKYLLPRHCPRVTFRADAQTSAEDVQLFFGRSSVRCVVAIESCWLETVQRTKLYRYHLPADTFKLALEDERTQYYISHQPVTPLSVTCIHDLLKALIDFRVELRIMPSLWPLYDAVVNSTLAFSIIRMRNAQPRDLAGVSCTL
ncbi:MAG: hypothetical protein OXU36_07250 [Candidatus Poribacteria bacterium]|nr:hypothetical protein [Candidatus Poribacteria bacterium]